MVSGEQHAGFSKGPTPVNMEPVHRMWMRDFRSSCVTRSGRYQRLTPESLRLTSESCFALKQIGCQIRAKQDQRYRWKALIHQPDWADSGPTECLDNITWGFGRVVREFLDMTSEGSKLDRDTTGSACWRHNM